jgi:hypothetical protein
MWSTMRKLMGACEDATSQYRRRRTCKVLYGAVQKGVIMKRFLSDTLSRCPQFASTVACPGRGSFLLSNGVNDLG